MPSRAFVLGVVTLLAAAEAHHGKINVPEESAYHSFDRSGLTKDAIRIVTEHVKETGSLDISVADLASQMRDFMGLYGYKAESQRIAKDVLGVWHKANPGTSAAADKELEVSPSATEDDAPITCTSRSMDSRCNRPSVDDDLALPEREIADEADETEGVKVAGTKIQVPPESAYHSFDRSGLTRDAIRLVTEYTEQTGNLDFTAEDLAAKMTDFMGMPQRTEAPAIAEMVLQVWKAANGQEASAGGLSGGSRKLGGEKESASEMAFKAWQKANAGSPSATEEIKAPSATEEIKAPAEADYHSFDRSGLTKDAIRIVTEHVKETGSLDITADEIASKMTDFMGMAQPTESPQIAEMVLKAWQKVNAGSPSATEDDAPIACTSRSMDSRCNRPSVDDDLALPESDASPDVSPEDEDASSPSPMEDQESPSPEEVLAGGINVPAESMYHSFDRSGLTRDAIRIVSEFVQKTGKLDIAVDDLAEEMRDFMGLKSMESTGIAKTVLTVWKLANPQLEATTTEPASTQGGLTGCTPTSCAEGAASASSRKLLESASQSRFTVIGGSIMAALMFAGVAVRKAMGAGAEEKSQESEESMIV